MGIIIQVIIRLTLYLDQAILRSGNQTGNGSRQWHGIENTVIIVVSITSFFCLTVPVRIFLSALLMRNIVYPLRIRKNRNVYVDVHRRPLSAQRCYSDRVSGTISAHILCHPWLGRSACNDGNMGWLCLKIPSWTKVFRRMKIRVDLTIIEFFFFCGK